MIMVFFFYSHLASIIYHQGSKVIKELKLFYIEMKQVFLLWDDHQTKLLIDT